VTVTTASKATRIIVTATSGRIAITVVIGTTTTSTRKMTRLLLIAATRRSSIMHGPMRNHTSEVCYKSLKNQNKHQAHDKKRQNKVHHINAHYTSDDN
jgi:hypothetical protein